MYNFILYLWELLAFHLISDPDPLRQKDPDPTRIRIRIHNIVSCD
jgi:hypothetical protein